MWGPTLRGVGDVDNAGSVDAVLGHLGAARMGLYLAAVAQDRERALDLYRWNARLAAAFFVDLGHLEVGLRNGLDARMSARHAALGRPATWLDDPTGELGRDLSGAQRHRRPYRDLVDARRRVSVNAKPMTHGQVLSETSLGLWHQLVSRRWTNLWPDLADAFPHAPDRARQTVAEPIADLRELRNRIGHHHRIWTLPCERRHDQLMALAGWISPVFRAWVGDGSAVPALLAARPTAPGGSPARGTHAR